MACLFNRIVACPVLSLYLHPYLDNLLNISNHDYFADLGLFLHEYDKVANIKLQISINKVI